MGTEVATRGTSYLATTADFLGNLNSFVGDLGGNVDGLFLKFDGNNGVWSYGSDDTELPLGSQVALDIGSLERGYICWKDGKPVDEVMASVMDGAKVNKMSLPDHGPYDEEEGDGWKEQLVVSFKMLDAPFNTLIFKAANATKINALSRLVKSYGAAVKSFMDTPVPVVEIDEQSFVAKAKKARGATKHAPVFKIIEWVTQDQIDNLVGGAPDDYVGEEVAGDEEVTEVEAVTANVPAASSTAAVATRPAPAARPAPASRTAAAPKAAAAVEPARAPTRAPPRGKFA